jgi:hypothetical protein
MDRQGGFWAEPYVVGQVPLKHPAPLWGFGFRKCCPNPTERKSECVGEIEERERERERARERKGERERERESVLPLLALGERLATLFHRRPFVGSFL